MKNIIKISILFISLFLYFSSSSANENIAFIDIDYIFNNSNKVKKIISNLEKLNKDTKKKFDRREKIIIDLDNEINQKKNILDKKELSSKIENLKKMAEDLRSFKNNQSNIYNQKRSSELKIFFNEINLKIPSDFNEDNFYNLNKYFTDIKGTPYSIDIISDILNKIDEIE